MMHATNPVPDTSLVARPRLGACLPPALVASVFFVLADGGLALALSSAHPADLVLYCRLKVSSMLLVACGAAGAAFFGRAWLVIGALVVHLAIVASWTIPRGHWHRLGDQAILVGGSAALLLFAWFRSRRDPSSGLLLFACRAEQVAAVSVIALGVFLFARSAWPLLG